MLMMLSADQTRRLSILGVSGVGSVIEGELKLIVRCVDGENW